MSIEQHSPTNLFSKNLRTKEVVDDIKKENTASPDMSLPTGKRNLSSTPWLI
jgi:hypothetical protein